MHVSYHKHLFFLICFRPQGHTESLGSLSLICNHHTTLPAAFINTMTLELASYLDEKLVARNPLDWLDH